MILQCTACSTRYLVPDNSIGASGRTVRCAKCKHTWFTPGITQPASDVADMVAEINIRPRPVPKGSNLPVKRKEKASIGLMAGVFGMVSVAVTILLIMFFPTLIGSPPSKGVVLSDVAFGQVESDSPNPIYEIRGKIHNTTGKTIAAPVLRVTLVDSTGSPLQYWDYSEEGKELAAGESIPFTTAGIEVKFKLANRFVVELGSPLELALREKP